jgi:uncharacterized protein
MSDQEEQPLHSSAAPIAAQERIVWLDVLRGFALLGILLINIVGFAWPMVYAEMLRLDLPGNALDDGVFTAVSWLVQGKFYTLFSLLFGIGCMIFMMNAEKKGKSPRRLFFRRVLILLIIGVLHGLFLWWGDILVMYAVCGMLLLLFYHCKPRTLLIWAGSLFSGFALLSLLSTGLMFVGDSISGAGENSLRAQMNAQYKTLYEQSFANYGSGGLSDIFTQRLADWGLSLSNLFVAPFVILPIFLIGAYVLRSGFLKTLQTDNGVLRRTIVWTAAVGVVFTGLKEYSAAKIKVDVTTVHETLQPILAFFGDLGLAGFYATLLLVLSRITRWQALLSSLQWAGRMALTNYLLQSVICCLLFYNVGLGLYGKIGVAGLALIALVIFSAQVMFSRWWFTRYSFGPMEWLWRRMTYGNWSAANPQAGERADG